MPVVKSSRVWAGPGGWGRKGGGAFEGGEVGGVAGAGWLNWGTHNAKKSFTQLHITAKHLPRYRLKEC